MQKFFKSQINLKKNIIILAILVLFTIISCDRFDNNFQNNVSVTEKIQVFFTAFENTLSTLQPTNIAEIMNFYDENYLNNGITKAETEQFYNSLFALADSIQIISELENSDENLNVNWRLIVKDSATDSVLIDSLIADKLIETRGDYLFYGNQYTPPSADKQKVLVQLFTGTWCPNCPYAEEALYELSQELSDTFYFLEIHIQDELALGSNFEIMNFYGIGSLPSTVFQGQNVIGGANESIIDVFRNAIQNYAEIDASAVLKNLEYELDGPDLSGSVQIELEESVSQENLFLKFSLVEIVSDVLNSAGAPCRQVVKANGDMDLSSLDLNNPVEFSFYTTANMPSDARFYLWLQTIEEPYNEETCKVYNVIEQDLSK